MQMIISCAKQIKMKDDFYVETTSPRFADQSRQLATIMKQMDIATLKKVLKCSDAIAQKTYHTYQSFSWDQAGTPAILAYSGIQYQYMASDVFTDQAYQFLQEHLWILCAFYGALRPLDAILPYRLDMQSKPGFSMYDFWQDQLATVIPDQPVLNLASEEYAKCIRPYRKLIDVKFCQEIKGKLVEKGVYVKMARGRMVRYMAENQIDDVSGICFFDDLRYIYSKEASTDTRYVFIQQ